MIPEMTDPLGKYWDQPDRSAITIDDTHALMTTATFKKLGEYSASCPSGVYPGKMWSRHDGLHDDRCAEKDRRWLLCWYDRSELGPDYCSTKFREILICD
jgi:hypothetical protein